MEQATSRRAKAIKALRIALAAIFVMSAVYILVVILKGFITGEGIGEDLARSLIAEIVAFALSLWAIDAFTRYIAKKEGEQRREPLEGVIYARLSRIIRDLAVDILPPEAYTENDRVYENIYGDRAARVDLKQNSYSHLFSLTKEHVERKYTKGETFSTELLSQAKEQLGRILDRSFSFLDPELVLYMVRLETCLERSIELLDGMKDKDWEERLSRQKVAYSLSLVASSVVKAREWLDRVLDKHFKEVAQHTYRPASEDTKL